MRLWTLRGVSSVCDMIRVRVSRYVRGLCIAVLEPHISALCILFLCLLLLLLLLLLTYHVCITPSFKLSGSLLRGGHGTTAVAEQVCVDHYLLCVC